MLIMLNGEPVTLGQHTAISVLIEQLGLAGKRIAVEVNENIVSRSEHATTFLQAGDRVEIVHAIGGG
jgi:sulfur carrier protein